MKNIMMFAAGLAMAGAVAAPHAIGQEADAFLRRAAAAMGADKVKSLSYTGKGMGSSFGQAFVPGMPWPKLNYSSYVRQVDYESVFTSEQVRRSRAEPKGGGAVPLAGEAAFGGVASATHAWNLAGPVPVPRNAALPGRLHDLWITPHGVIKAAIKHKSTLAFRTEAGRSLAAISFAVPGALTATAIFNEDFLVERVESRMPDAVLGDTPVVTRYSNYRDHQGVKFPARIEQQASGAMTLALDISEVTPNAAVNSSVPEHVARAAERVAAEKVADGVWHLAGGSHNSVAIEMADHVVLVEAPLGDERTALVFQEVRKLVPNKPVRYVVNSHNHFDHSGGLRAAAAHGATIVVQAQSKPYFEKMFANPNRIVPDLLAKSGRRANFIAVGEQMVLKDATRTVELHRIKNTDHVDTFLMVYLPRERLLVEADAFTPLAPNAAAPKPVNAYHANLVENLERLKLQVERILPLHGRVVPLAELHRMVGR